jgi:hypothetical protein
MMMHTRRPLRPGTVLDYCGMRATVVADSGGERLDVDCEGHVQPWRWTFEGESCTVVSEPHGKLHYDTFEDYVADWPDGERSRAWVTNHGHRTAALVKLVDPSHQGSPHGGLPGNYAWVSLSTDSERTRMTLHDCDDGAIVRDWPAGSGAGAQEVLAQMKQLAPFSFWEAVKVFDFKWD